MRGHVSGHKMPLFIQTGKIKSATGNGFGVKKYRASALQAEGRRFEPVNSHTYNVHIYKRLCCLISLQTSCSGCQGHKPGHTFKTIHHEILKLLHYAPYFVT